MKIRTIKDKDYTVMSNYHFKDKELSLRVKRIWTFKITYLGSRELER